MSDQKFIITNTSTLRLNILDMFLLAPNYTVDIFKQFLPLPVEALTSKIVEDLKYTGQLSRWITDGKIAVVEVSPDFFSALGMSTPVEASDITPEVIGAERVGVAASLVETHLTNPHAHPQYTNETFVLTAANDAVTIHANDANAHPQFASQTAAIVAAAITDHTNALDPHVQYASPVKVDAIVEDAILEHSILDNPHPQYLSSSTAAIQINDAINVHLAQDNPHFQYAKASELTAVFSAHVSDPDPHSQYETSADVYEKLAEHTSAANPHSQYATTTVVGDSIEVALLNHVNLANPHSQYASLTYTNAQMSAHLAALDPHSQYITSANVDAKIATHVSLSNPHTQYVLASEIDGYVAASVAGEIADHISDLNPHPQYALDTDLTSAIATHVALPNPHTQYQLTSQKNASLGYAGLDLFARLNIAQIPTGTTSTTVALGDAAANAVSAHAALSTAHGISTYGSSLVGVANSSAALAVLGIPASVTSLSGVNTGDQTISLTGDIVGSGTGTFSATISSNAVTNSKLSSVPTSSFKGRVTSGTGDVEDLNSAQATSLLNTFTSGLKGLVPASGGGTTTFLRADGVFSTPAAIIADGDYGDIVISGSGTTLTLDSNVVTNTKFRQSAALSVVGRSANTAGNVADISVIANSGLVLREDGAGNISFGTISSAGLSDGAVSFAKMQNVSTDRILGRDSAGTGTVEEIGLNSTLEFAGSGMIQRAALNGDVVATAGSNTTAIGTGVVTNAKLANVPTASFKGRVTSGSGSPEDLTATQATALLNTFTSALKGLVPASGGGTTTFLRADGTFAAPAGATIADGDYGDISISGTGTVFTIDANTITDSKLRTSAALSVLGRSSNSTGNIADITTTSNSGLVLREDGAGTIGFGTISTAGISDSAVSFAKIQTIATDSLLGRDSASTGAVESITLNSTLEFSGTGTIQRAALTGDVTATAGSNTTTIAAGVVSNTKLANIATSTIKGRVSAGSGVVEDLSVSQAKTLLQVNNVDNTSDLLKPISSANQSALDLKVDKVAGKQLSTEDYTTAEKTKLSGIEAGAEVNNISDGYVLDLTDGGDTTLHIHDSRYYTEAEVDLLLSAVNTNTIEKITTKLTENISKGQAVYISGASGTNILISKASNDTEAKSSKVLGLLEVSGVNNDICNVVTSGILIGLNTSSATIGDAVWLGVNGNLLYGLANKPYAPAHLVYIGLVTMVSATVGEIFINPQNGFELDELHDVQILSSANGQTLVHDAGLWKNKYTYEYLVTNWSSPPTLNTSISSGEVYNYTLFGVTRYRFVPSPYDSSQDAFYQNFDGVDLTNIIITRG